MLTRFASQLVLTAGVLFALGRPSEARNAFHFDDLVSLIQKNGITSLEQVLPLLPSELRTNFTMVYDGRALQQATQDSPVVIMFQGDGRFVMSFGSGDPKLAGFDGFDVMEFHDDTKEFELRNIKFAPPAAPVISEKNPARCVSCHRNDPRPNWETYPTWPGFFGSNDDALLGYEGEMFTKFMANAGKTGRYQYLTPPAGSAVTPFRATKDDVDTRFRPNNRLGKALTRLNAQRVLRMIRASKYYPKYRDLLFFKETFSQFSCDQTNLSDSDYAKIRDELQKDLAAQGMTPSFPPDSRVSITDLYRVLGADAFDVTMHFRNMPTLDTFYFDGLNVIPAFIAYQSLAEEAQLIPGVEKGFDVMSISSVMAQAPAFASIYINVPEFVAEMDQMGAALSAKDSCPVDLVARIKAGFGL